MWAGSLGWEDPLEKEMACFNAILYIIICEIDRQSLMHETGCSGLVHWDDPEGRGAHVHPWLIHVNVWQKPLQYCKVISLQLK